MRKSTLSLMVIVFVIAGCQADNGPRRSEQAEDLAPLSKQPVAAPAPGTVRMNVSLEGGASAPVKIIFKEQKLVREAKPGRVDLDLSSAPAGSYYIYFESPGYASRWVRIKLEDDGSGTPISVELYRERYVVMRYAFNPDGGRSLTGGDVREERVAVAHWGPMQWFGQDWQVWQSGAGGEGFFGKTPYLQFHRYSSGFGFVRATGDATFDGLKEAPETGYRCENEEAIQGTLLFCRVNGNRSQGLGYGKILIEDVTEQPPQGVRVIRAKSRE